MRSPVVRALQALCNGRGLCAVALEIAALFAMAGVLWASACALLVIGGAS